MRLALDGDQTAYRTLLTEIVPHVRGQARRVLARHHGGGSMLDDVVQETLLAIHLKRASWDRSMAFLPWLNAIVRYKSLDVMRRSVMRGEVDLDHIVETAATPAQDDDNHIDSQRILALLDGRDRQIVEQMSLAGRSAADVGRQLGLSEGAVRVALHRALKRLARTLRGSRDAD